MGTCSWNNGNSRYIDVDFDDLNLNEELEQDLQAEFTLRQGTENLATQLTIKNASSEKLKNIISIRHSASRNIHAKFEAQPNISLKALFTLRQETKDLYAKFKSQTTVGLSAAAIIRQSTFQKLKAIFTIRRSVPEWSTHESFIDDITPWHYTWTEEPVGNPPQRKAFQAKGRLWITYHSDNRLWYKTSLDGRIWSAAQTFREEGEEHSGDYFAVHFDGQYIHYVYGGGYSEPCYYRRGEPQTDGSILWSGAEVVAKAAIATDSYRYPNIGVDENGYPFISYSHVDSSIFRRPYVLRSSNNDGTWATAEQHTLNITTGAYYTSCIPLPNGNMLIFYTRYYTVDSLKAQEWDGSSWTDRDPNGDSKFTALADNEGTIHLVYRHRDTHKIYYMQLSGETWSDATEIASSDDGSSWPILTLDHDDTIWVFWEENDYIHYIHKLSDGSWSEETIYEQTHGTIRYYQVSAPVKAAFGGSMKGTQIPVYFHIGNIEKFYVVLFEYLAPELKAIFHIGQDSAALKAEFRITAEDLSAEAVIRHSSYIGLTSEFLLRSLGAINLLSHLKLIPVEDLYAKFKVRQQYNITGWKGVSFLWYGGGGWDQLVEFEIHSSTGFWRARFYDGPAKYRFVFIPLNNFTEAGIDGTRPNPEEITAFLWTYHTQGTRKVSAFSIWYVNTVPDLFAKVKVVRTASETLQAEFSVRSLGEDLKANFNVRPILRGILLGNTNYPYYYDGVKYVFWQFNAYQPYYVDIWYWIQDAAIRSNGSMPEPGYRLFTFNKPQSAGSTFGLETRILGTYYDYTGVYELRARIGDIGADDRITWANFGSITSIFSSLAKGETSAIAHVEGSDRVWITNFSYTEVDGTGDMIWIRTDDVTWTKYAKCIAGQTKYRLMSLGEGYDKKIVEAYATLSNPTILIVRDRDLELADCGTPVTLSNNAELDTVSLANDTVNDLIHIVFLDRNTGAIEHYSMSKGSPGTWSYKGQIKTILPIKTPCVGASFDPTTRRLYILYSDDNKIYRKYWADGLYSSEKVIYTERSEITDLAVYPSSLEGKIVYSWEFEYPPDAEFWSELGKYGQGSQYPYHNTLKAVWVETLDIASDN